MGGESSNGNGSRLRRAAVYARQSKYRHESVSIPVQLDTCREAAPRLGLEVVTELVDKVSGYKKRGLERPQWKELLKLLEGGEVEAVIVYTSERLSRGGGPGWAPFIEACESVKLDLDRVVATPSGFMSEFEIGLRATMDREESKKIALRVSDVAERRARAGEPNGGGRRAFGYTDNQFSTIVAEEAELLRDARDRLLGGESIRAICKDWNSRGLVTTTGSRWEPHNLGRMLRSPHLAGRRVFRGREVAGNWPAIFTVEEHKAINLAAGYKYEMKVPRHLLTGLLKCGSCACNLRRKNTKRAGGQYVCQTDGCWKTAIQAGPVEELIEGAAVDLLSRPLVRQALADLGRSKSSAELAQRLEDDRQALEQVSRDHYVDRLISREAFLAASEALEERIRAAEASLSSRRPTVAIPAGIEAVAKLWNESSLEWRRQVLALLAESFTVTSVGRVSGGVFKPERVVPVWRY